MTKPTWDYKGYTCELNTISYNCPKLKLFGYATERQLHSAINRKIKKLTNDKI